jgi:rubrerythrin
MKLVSFLRMMVAEEEAAKAKYEMAAAEAEDDKIRQMLLKLAYEEEMHADLLQQHIDELEG